MGQSLAVRYRPKTFDDVTEQGAVKTILEQQIKSGEIQHAYLFTGGAGTGKTTCARIFANEINHGKGTPLELDGASNNSVDDVRDIIQQSKLRSIDSEYRVFILDEVHAFSNSAWQSMLKLLEEPPEKSVFIMCTTNPEKIPRTILSRVQRFDFKRISQQGIINRLCHILSREYPSKIGVNDIALKVDREAIEYIAKIADGGMRDAITLLDKCLSYSTELTMENVLQALGTVDYEVFFELTDAISNKKDGYAIKVIEQVYADGKDLKQFIKDYLGFIIDVNKYDILKGFEYIQIPITYKVALQNYTESWFVTCRELLPVLVKLNSDLKWETQTKVVIEAVLLKEIYR